MRTMGGERRGKLAILVGALLLWGGVALAQNAPPPLPNQQEGDYVVGNFRFQGGETLPELKLHYTTAGTPVRDSGGRITNAVLLLHGTTGTGKNFLAPNLAGPLFGPGGPLDATKFFLIMPDGIGRGGSSKPSDGLRTKFPRYGYVDVVEAQHAVVQEALGVEHLRLVLGTSMGGMQAWIWGERYPDMMDALMPIASQPVEISGRNMMWRRLIIEAIRTDPEWNNGNYEKQPSRFVAVLPVFNFMVESPVRLQEMAPTREKANQLYDQWVQNYRKSVDANDFLYWFDSSYDYNPSPDLGKITARVLAVNFADDELNPPELGVMEREIGRIKGARVVTLPASNRTHGHQTLAQAALWKDYVTELLR